MRIMAPRFLAFAAFAVLAGCQTDPRPKGMESLDVAALVECSDAECYCNARVCRIPVDVRSCTSTGGMPTVRSMRINVQGNFEPRLVWVITPASSNWVFYRGSGVVLKNPASDPTGQFYQKYVADDADNPVPGLVTGKRFHWRNQNILTEVNTYEYEINVYRADNPNAPRCHLDPTIQNRG